MNNRELGEWWMNATEEDKYASWTDYTSMATNMGQPYDDYVTFCNTSDVMAQMMVLGDE